MVDVARHLHQLLVQALLERGSDAAAPVTVAEIYQELVPYRAVRERLGVELNADYEHALLRLLAGEDELLRLEPASARDELRQELASPNPYVGIYRKFAACDVWVEFDDEAPALAAAESPAAPKQAEAENGTAVESTVLATPAASLHPFLAPKQASPPPSGEEVARVEPQAAVRRSTPAPSPAPAQAVPKTAKGDECGFCHEELPPGRVVRFCPHCGKDQRLRPCGRCGEALEKSWRYCIGCGTPAAGTAAAAPVGARA